MIYNNGLETETLEFKKSLAELDKGIVSLTAMLNKGGFGKVVFGVDNKGGIVGTELGNETIRKISIRCNEGIRPAMVPKISVENFDGKMVVSLEGRGNRRPYSAFGDYRIRVGSEKKKIDPEELGDLFFSNPNFAADNLECIDQDLTFVQLKTLFSDRGLKINEKTFAKNMGLLTAKGKYNCVADILADNNNCSMKVVRFAGRDKINDRKGVVDKALRKAFPPEFINRIDEKVHFRSLERSDMERILDIELRGLRERVEEAGYRFSISRAASEFVAGAGYDPIYGARPLKRAITRYVEDPVSELIISERLAGHIIDGAVLCVGLNKDKTDTKVTIRNRP